MKPRCSYCGSENISQAGLAPILVRLGYYKCLDCGKTGKPLTPDASAASEPVTQPA